MQNNSYNSAGEIAKTLDINRNTHHTPILDIIEKRILHHGGHDELQKAFDLDPVFDNDLDTASDSSDKERKSPKPIRAVQGDHVRNKYQKDKQLESENSNSDDKTDRMKIDDQSMKIKWWTGGLME